jgi:4-hydroxybenzoate polyprenyltransferase
MNKPPRYANSAPAIDRDIDAAHKRCIDIKATRYQQHLADDASLRRMIALVLLLLLAIAVLILELSK